MTNVLINTYVHQLVCHVPVIEWKIRSVRILSAGFDTVLMPNEPTINYYGHIYYNAR